MKQKKKGKKKTTLPYRTISLPNDIYKAVDSHVKEHTEYVSIANFVRQSIREKMRNDSFIIKPPRVQDSYVPVRKDVLMKEFDKINERLKKLESKKNNVNNF